MVYDAKTFRVLHGLTPRGRDAYHKMLEDEADEILFKHQHPFRWFAGKIAELAARLKAARRRRA